MKDLETRAGGMRRREFLESSFYIPAMLLDYQTNTETSIKSKLERKGKLDVQSLPKIIVADSQSPHLISKLDLQTDLEFLRREPDLKGKSIQNLDARLSQAGVFVRFEPDIEYAKQLADLTKTFVRDFCMSAGITDQSQNLIFTVPRSPGEVSYKANANIFYIVADVAEFVNTYYTLTANGVPYAKVVSRNLPVGGQVARGISFDKRDNKSQIKQFTFSPIFSVTTSKPAYLVTAPVAEVFHKYIAPYTGRHIELALKEINPPEGEVATLISNLLRREEQFVHAINLLWFRDFNRRKLGLTAPEVQEAINTYKDNYYKGTMEMMDRVSKLGFKKAISLYANNPAELFKGIPL